MKEVYVVRHGKSSWSEKDISDIDRPLKERGINDSASMAEFMEENNLLPDLIYSSPANRASHTAFIMARELNIPSTRISIENGLYFGDSSTFKNIIKKTNNNIEKIMLVGHNPSVTIFTESFLKSQYLDKFPTAGLIQIIFECNSWEDISVKNIKGMNQASPRRLSLNNLI